MYDISDPELYELVRKIYQGRFAWRVRKAGGDEDDCFQEILRSIHIRNQGKNPYDAGKGAPSNWAYQVCRSVVVNHVDKLARKWWLDLGTGEDVALWERDQLGLSEEDFGISEEPDFEDPDFEDPEDPEFETLHSTRPRLTWIAEDQGLDSQLEQLGMFHGSMTQEDIELTHEEMSQLCHGHG